MLAGNTPEKSVESGMERPDLHSVRTTILTFSLIDLAFQLARRVRLIGKTVLTALLLGGVLCLILPVRYTATTKILTPQETPSAESFLVAQLRGSRAALAEQAMGLRNPNDTYVGMLRSRPVADALIVRFSLLAAYHAKDMTAARSKLAARTVVEAEKDGFIVISVTDRDKNRAAAIANAYTDALRSLTKKMAVTEASQRRLFYEEQLSDANVALVEAEAGFERIQQKKGMVQPGAQTTAIIQGLSMLRAQIAAKQVELHGLQTYSTERNPEVQLAEHQLSTLEAEAASVGRRSRASAFGDLSLKDVPDAGMDYLRAQHEIEYRQAVYDLLMKQYDAAKLDEAKEASIIQVVESAIPPERRSSPRYVEIMLLSLFGGIVAGSALALISWWRSNLAADPLRAQQVQELRSAILGHPHRPN